ncbi:hypothetical protein [Clostridium gasigenes]|uniref:YobI family P-loop NTPase n=1 Tax=Clostridium gasigenes TaxID=94869 RepID=UPI001C0BFBDF|nr:hypothetical protein [Clostridium gasigenes]MBU3109662.1 hypothetical protein [Clostridium gasigenes]
MGKEWKKMRWVLNKLINKLTYCEDKLAPKVENKNRYLELTPKDDIETNDNYLETLKWAIENEKLNNIAISGPYGSGKSSIIESFKKNHKEYKYINISLATFVEADGSDIETNIEKSILQQMFYKVRHKDIPYSRFRKIKNIKGYDARKVMALYLCCIATVGIILKPQIIEGSKRNIDILKVLILKTPILMKIPNLVIWIIISIAVFTMYKILYYFTRLIMSKFKINKIKNKNGTVEMGEDGGESVFNKYLDEIVYFFESTKHNVVFFEDLDRFDDIKIFTKLRELNILINNSEDRSGRVKFIYAIKDDIFYDKSTEGSSEKEQTKQKIEKRDSKNFSKNRTKFFDFIMPVIPTINAENSCDMLMNMFKQLNKDKKQDEIVKVSDQLISDVSIFVDDMRILVNIFNEFITYNILLKDDKKRSESIKGSFDLKPDNLFAMIVYKNLYPIDFSMLQLQNGMIYRIFEDKHKLIESSITNIEMQIQKKEKYIEILKREYLENLDELRCIYLEAWKKRGVLRLKIDNQEYNLESIEQSYIREKLEDFDEINYYNINGHGNNIIKTEDLLTIYGEKSNYYYRLDALEYRKNTTIEEGIEKIRKEVYVLKRNENEIRSESLKNLLQKAEYEVKLSSEIEKEKLIMRLLRYGYIDEMYNSYISYFYEGSLTKGDFKFIGNVMNQKIMDFNFKLSNNEKILTKFRINDFKEDSILNIDLITFMLSNKRKYKFQLDTIIERLGKMDSVAIGFIDMFSDINKTNEFGGFIYEICKKVDNFWFDIINKSNFIEDKINMVLVNIISYADLDDIGKQNANRALTKYISNNGDFVNIIYKDVQLDKLKAVLIKLNIKFESIDGEYLKAVRDMECIDDLRVEIIQYIYEKNLYSINKDMLKFIISFINYDKDINLEYGSYSYIKKSGLVDMVRYIDGNINNYIVDIFLESVTELEENNDVMEELINNKDVNEVLICRVIEEKQFKISNINTIDNKDVWGNLIRSSKVNSLWVNILSYYNNIGIIDDTIVAFLNSEKVYNKIKLDKLYTENINEDSVNSFVEDIIRNRNIYEITLENISIVFANKFSEINLVGLQDERVELLIRKDIISLSESNYKQLKDNYEPYNINLLIKYISEYIDNSDRYDVSEKDFDFIIKSDQINNEDKFKIVKKIDLDTINKHSEVWNSIYDILCVNEFNIEIQESLLQKLLASGICKTYKINLIIAKLDTLDKEFIISNLANIGKEYVDILNKDEYVDIENDGFKEWILSEIRKLGYISWNNIEPKEIKDAKKLNESLEKFEKLLSNSINKDIRYRIQRYDYKNDVLNDYRIRNKDIEIEVGNEVIRNTNIKDISFTHHEDRVDVWLYGDMTNKFKILLK